MDTLVVDKTGTLTYGHPQVTEIVPLEDASTDEILALAAALEHSASHPLASALLKAADANALALPTVQEVEVLPSRGVIGKSRDQRLILVARRLLDEQGISLPPEHEERVASLEQQGKTVLALVRSGLVVGVIAVADTNRAEILVALAQVRRLGIKRILLLTGDNERVAQAIAREAGITEVAANLLPI